MCNGAFGGELAAEAKRKASVSGVPMTRAVVRTSCALRTRRSKVPVPLDAFRRGRPVYIDYPFEDVVFRWEDDRVFAKFYGETDETERPQESKLTVQSFCPEYARFKKWLNENEWRLRAPVI